MGTCRAADGLAGGAGRGPRGAPAGGCRAGGGCRAASAAAARRRVSGGPPRSLRPGRQGGRNEGFRFAALSCATPCGFERRFLCCSVLRAGLRICINTPPGMVSPAGVNSSCLVANSSCAMPQRSKHRSREPKMPRKAGCAPLPSSHCLARFLPAAVWSLQEHCSMAASLVL